MPVGIRALLGLSAWLGPGALALSLARHAAEPIDTDVQCLPENRQALAATLQEAFERQGFSERVREMYSSFKKRKKHGTVMMTIGESRTNLLFRNFWVHAQNMSKVEDVRYEFVYVALDSGGLDNCYAVSKESHSKGLKWPRLHCLDLTGWLPDQFFLSKDQKEAQYRMGAQAGSCGYNVIIWTKPHILYAAQRACQGCSIFMLDSDIILYRDVVGFANELLQNNPNKTFVTGQEYAFVGTFPFSVNTGTVVSTPAASSLKVLKTWVDWDARYLNEKAGDQQALIEIFKNGRRRKPLIRIPNTVVGQCAVRGSHATHYNCYGNKLRPMSRNGDWQQVGEDKDKRLAKLRGSADLAMDGIYDLIAAMRASGDWLLEGDPDS